MVEVVKEQMKTWYRGYVSYLTVTPILVTVAIIAASIIAGAATARNLDTVQSQAVDKQMRENSLLIQNTFSSYEQIIWSEVGRINSAPLDRSMWASFVNTYRLKEDFPAITRLGVTRILSSDEQAAYMSDLSVQYGQDVQVKNDTPGSATNIIAFSSPEGATTINNIGYNILSSPNRKAATDRATDNNAVAMSDQTELLLDAKKQQTTDGAAFLMYAPYYRQGAPIDTVEQRRSAIQGHAFASFKTQKVFEQIFERVDHSHIAINVSTKQDGKDRTVFSSEATKQSGSVITRLQTVNVYGQTFTINYDFDKNFLVSNTQLTAPLYTILFGSLVGLLVGTVTFFFLRGRYHQVLLDKERDVTRAKDELLSLASHQLRTPATGVKQYMGMVLQGFAGPITEVQEDMLSKAYKSNERQLRVINDILHLAKLDLGRIVLAKTHFDLADLIADVIEEQSRDIETAHLKLTTKIIKKAPIHADKHMLRMVVENLVSNAIKYTDPGGKLFIQLRQRGDGYYIIVKDSGVGVGADDIPQLFKQFSRIQNARSHLVTGTGVGLYLARHLTQLHDGDIAVESELGKGSSFMVYIPKNNESL
ncbi:CHASE domain-containing protein [Candidatus Saccharibacteria bacterium]|nr:CHASE domain-containing protein [Candidatus Saccharibacteria bacterium]